MIKKIIMYIRKCAQWVNWSTKYYPLCIAFFLHPTPTSVLSYQKGGESYDSLHQTVRTLRPILSTLASHVRTYVTGGIFINQAKQVLSFISSSFPFLTSLFSTLLLFSSLPIHRLWISTIKSYVLLLSIARLHIISLYWLPFPLPFLSLLLSIAW